MADKFAVAHNVPSGLFTCLNCLKGQLQFSHVPLVHVVMTN